MVKPHPSETEQICKKNDFAHTTLTQGYFPHTDTEGGRDEGLSGTSHPQGNEKSR